MLADDRDGVLTGEGRLAGEQLVEHRPERVEVRARVGAAPERLLGRQIGDRSHQHPLDRRARAPVARREAEVAEPRGAVVAEPDVGRLEVAMDDAARMGVLERAADVDRDRERPVDVQAPPLALLEHPGEIAAADVLADDVGNPILLARIEHPDHVPMLAELPHRLGLAPGPREDRLLDPLGLEHRHGDLAIAGLGVTGPVDALTPAAAEEPLDAIAPGDHLGGVGRCRGGRRLRLRRSLEARAAAVAEPSLGTVEIAA
jgi:hypothetical protein